MLAPTRCCLRQSFQWRLVTTEQFTYSVIYPSLSGELYSAVNCIRLYVYGAQRVSTPNVWMCVRL